MTIMIYDVAASEGGALSVLNDLYKKIIEDMDKDTKWVIVVSTPVLKNAENIEIIRIPQIKNSWVHRIYYDYTVPQKIVKKYDVDIIVSLQDILVPRMKKPQIVFLHDSLLFSEKRIKLVENPIIWLYQNPLGSLKLKSVKKATRTIVQTKWMKEECLKRTDCDEERISVVYPDTNIEYEKKELTIKAGLFFYPATAFEYKNHMTLLRAFRQLDQENNTLVLSIRGDENKYAKELKSYCINNKLSVEFRGRMERDEVYRLYFSSVLVFPSTIESFGLPLAEAKSAGTIIIAADFEYSREILEDYPNKFLFNAYDYKQLERIMKNLVYSDIKKYVNKMDDRKSLQQSIKDISKEILG